MAMPRKSKTDINIAPTIIGTEFLKFGDKRVEELMALTDEKSTYLPKTIGFREIDEHMFKFVRDGELRLILKGKEVPVIFLNNERWAEFSKTWTFADKDKNVVTPFMTVHRIDKGPGTRLDTKWTIPQRKAFRYLEIPVVDNGDVIKLVFKMPEPVAVDLTYDVRIFTKMLRHINKSDEQVLKAFANRQAYIFVNGQPFPVLLEDMTDEGTLDAVGGDRYHVTSYTLKTLAFIQDEDEFEIIKSARQTKIKFTIDETSSSKRILDGSVLCALLQTKLGTQKFFESSVFKVNGCGGGNGCACGTNVDNSINNISTITNNVTTNNDPILQYYYVNDVDEIVAQNRKYIGAARTDGDWLLRRLDQPDPAVTDIIIQYANLSNNAGILTYNDAWAARLTLSYANIETLTFTPLP